jgi:hypothetical protein
MNTLTTADIRPCDEDVALAQKSLSTLLRTCTKNHQVDFIDGNGSVLPIPTSTLLLLQEMLTEISKGNILAIIPSQAEIVDTDAADLLNIPLSSLMQLIEADEIPVCKADTHQRVRYRDVVDYKKRSCQMPCGFK